MGMKGCTVSLATAEESVVNKAIVQAVYYKAFERMHVKATCHSDQTNTRW